MMFKATYALAVILMIILLAGCSKSSPVIPENQENTTSSDMEVLMSGTMVLNPDDSTISFLQREGSINYNITGLLNSGCPGGCFKYQIISINGSEWEIELTIKNPTTIQVYDVRLVYENLYGKTVLNPDSYTDVFHPFLTMMPFTAFATDNPIRAFPVSEGAEDSQILMLDFPAGASPLVDFFIIAHLPGNTRDVYEINNIKKDGILTPTGGNAEISCMVYDHQDDVHYVVADTTSITGGYTFFAGDPVVPELYTADISNTAHAPVGVYTCPILAMSPNPQRIGTYNYIDIEVTSIAGWTDPILVAGDERKDEYLPRLLLRDSDYWVIYTNGGQVLSKTSNDMGYTWPSTGTAIGTYSNVDTLHAVLGGNDNIYVQYQQSDNKYTYIAKYDGSTWTGPVETSYHGMTVPPYSCDLGIGSDGHIYDMTTGSWSTLGFRSDNPWDISSFSSVPIESFYNGVYSMNDGFVQWSDIPKFFFVHDETELDYAWFDGTIWNKNAARTGVETLIEPAIAPESDGPYHGVITVWDGTENRIEYFKYNELPPVAPVYITLDDEITDRMHSSISIDGSMISILYDADNEVRYIESTDGGATFGSVTVLSTGSYYSHVRRDAKSGCVVAAYSVEEGGVYNVYIRIKS